MTHANGYRQISGEIGGSPGVRSSSDLLGFVHRRIVWGEFIVGSFGVRSSSDLWASVCWLVRVSCDLLVLMVQASLAVCGSLETVVPAVC